MNRGLIFKDIPDKREYKETTSLKFKEDLLTLFEDIGNEYTCLELGTNHGHTTRVLSFIFKNVITLDWREEPNLRMARELNSDRHNITYIQKDVYTSWGDLNLPIFEVAFIDCCHTKPHVISDIQNCIKYGSKNQYMIFDDYGHPKTNVREAVRDVCSNNTKFQAIQNIGEGIGSMCRPGISLIDSEGIICKYEN